ncbi:MAG: M67 family metallopeptidase [Sphingomonadales bacterium]|nr:M67 family metallopeptidase [Sphingomonadales bacterium]
MGAVIRQATLDAVTAAASAAYPEECCGLLIGAKEGDRWRIDEAVAAANVAPRPRHDHFEIDPALHLRLQRELRGTAQAVIGHYHSHPNGRAAPSRADMAQAEDPSRLWLIAAVAGDAVKVAAFRLTGGAFIKVDLNVGES